MKLEVYSVNAVANCKFELQIMHCSSCGAELQDTFNFCSSCGIKVGNNQQQSQQQPHPKRQSTLPTFAQFAKSKSAERQSNFKPNKRSKPNVHEVTLNIGLMEYVGNELKPTRGGSLPLKIADNSNYDVLLTAALKKREAFDKRFRRERGYVLAYPDTSLARKIPGSQEEFLLKKYKEWLGKPYSRMTFYLSPSTSEDELDEMAFNSDDDITFNTDDDFALTTGNDNGVNSLSNEVEQSEVSLAELSSGGHLMVTPYLTTDFM